MERMIFVQLFGPMLKTGQFEVSTFGIVLAFSTAFESFGAGQGAKLRRYFKDHYAVGFLSLGIGIAILIMSAMDKISIIFGLAAMALACGLAFPIQKQLFNDHIFNPEIRATLLSIESLIDRTICAVLSYMIGLYLDTGRISEIFISLGFFCIRPPSCVHDVRASVANHETEV